MECAARGIGFSCPDLNEPSFETLTVTRMLEQTRAAIDAAGEGSVMLVGSSLGGFVAVHAAAADTSARIKRLVLMAPAFDFGGNRLRQLGDHGIEQWRTEGSLEFYHYAHNQPRRVWFKLYEDAAQYDAFALKLSLPIQIFQGLHDDTVLPGSVADWAVGRENVELTWLDDNHQLTASVEPIVRAAFSVNNEPKVQP